MEITLTLEVVNDFQVPPRYLLSFELRPGAGTPGCGMVFTLGFVGLLLIGAGAGRLDAMVIHRARSKTKQRGLMASISVIVWGSV